jgi:hypothetical protein
MGAPLRSLAPWLLLTATVLGAGPGSGAAGAPPPLWSPGTSALLQQGLDLRKGQTKGDALVALARRAIGRPYVAFSLDQSPVERLRLDLSSFDCFLFVEQLLAVVQLQPQGSTAGAFAEQVRQLRYDGGRVDYCHRHHYLSRWAAAAQRKGILSDITASLPGARSRRIPLRFMGDYAEAFRPMQQATNRRCITTLEQGLRVEQFYVPTAALGGAIPRLRNGDIFALVTRVKGLDVSHVGFVEVEGARRHAIHAAPGRGVMRSRDLARYVAGVEDGLGVMVLRPAP